MYWLKIANTRGVSLFLTTLACLCTFCERQVIIQRFVKDRWSSKGLLCFLCLKRSFCKDLSSSISDHMNNTLIWITPSYSIKVQNEIILYAGTCLRAILNVFVMLCVNPEWVVISPRGSLKIVLGFLKTLPQTALIYMCAQEEKKTRRITSKWFVTYILLQNVSNKSFENHEVIRRVFSLWCIRLVLV